MKTWSLIYLAFLIALDEQPVLTTKLEISVWNWIVKSILPSSNSFSDREDDASGWVWGFLELKGYADVYIEEAIEVATRPFDPNEPIPRELMVALEKLIAEGGLMETKMILGWLFNFRTLTVTLPEHKYIAWSWEIKQMIEKRWTTKKQLESTIRRMGHVGFVIPWVYHFLSCLRSLLAQAWNRRAISIDRKCIKDLKLMQTILNKAKEGIDMNLLAFRLPDRCPRPLPTGGR